MNPTYLHFSCAGPETSLHCSVQALQQLLIPLRAWKEPSQAGPAASRVSLSVEAVVNILGASNLKALAGATNVLVRNSGVGNVVYVVGTDVKREFDTFPSGSDWANVSNAKPVNLPAAVPPALSSLPDDLPPPCSGGVADVAGLTNTSAIMVGYSAEETEEDRQRRMAVRIQREWRSWWEREVFRRMCSRLRLFCGAR